MRNFRALLLLVLVVGLAGTPLFGQGQQGSVSGTVVDPTDAVVPGASVTLTNEATNISRQLSTNAQGVFIFDRVLPGYYTLTVTMEGFQKLEVTRLDVRVSKNTDLGNMRLQVGSVGETVQVEAGTAPLVETQSAQITNSLSNRQTVALRQGFGGLDGLAILTPGVIPGMGNINSNGMQVAANGQRSRSTQFMMDGHQMNDITIGGPSFFVGNLDTIAEYQVITNQFSAEYGRNLGATVNIITKGGGNSHHGGVFWLHQTSALDSKSARQSQTNSKKPVYNINNWGLNVTGPVLRNKLFYSGQYRGLKQPGQTTSLGTSSNRVITPNGISALRAAFPTSVPVQIYQNAGPFARTDGNPRCISGTTVTLSLTNGTTTVPTEACNLQRDRGIATTFWEYGIRMDYEFSEKHSFFGRWLRQNNSFCCSGGLDGYWWAVPNDNRSTSVTYVNKITPQLVNNFKFNWSRFLVAFEGANTEPISNVRANLANFSMPSGFLSFGLPTNLPQNRLLNTQHYQNTLSYFKGKHFMKVGVDFQYNKTSLFFLPFINGQFAFTSTAWTDFINNTPAQVSFTAGQGTFDPVEFDQAYYFQDDWRITPNLTINIGIRYEHNGQPINRAVDEIAKRESDPATAFWLLTVPFAQRTMPRLRNDGNNWAPRIGFAWNPDTDNWLFGRKKTTIRGGYGMAYELAFYNILLNMTTAAPRVFAFSLTGSSVIPVPGAGLGSDVASAIPVPRNTFDPRTFFQTQLSSDFHNPYGQNWSLGIQREIGRTQVFEVRYVGTNGIGLFQSRNANPLFTRMAAASTLATQPFGSTTNMAAFGGFGTVTMPGVPQFVIGSPLFPGNPITPCPPPPTTTPATPAPNGQGRFDCNFRQIRQRLNSGISNYHSLQVRYDVRNWKGQLTTSTSYTWSKGIDNVSEIFGFFGDGSIAFAENPFDIVRAERGVSNQNLKQTLALSYIWEIPFMRSQQGALGRIVGGWEISGLTTFLSGRPYTPIQRTGNRYCGEDSGFNNSFAGLLALCRPFTGNPNAPLTFTLSSGTIIPNVGYVSGTGTIHRATSAGAPSLSDPTVTVNDVRFIFNDDNAIRFLGLNPFGIGRNNFRGDYTQNWDIAITKRVKVTETVNVRYRMAMVNAFNRRNFGTPLIRVDLADFSIPSRNDAGGRSIRMGLWVEY